MDYDKLIERLYKHDKDYGEGRTQDFFRVCLDCKDAATALPNEWVRVEDAMPPEHEPVLCIVDGKPKPNITLEDAYQIGSWNKADGWIIDEYLDWEDADVSWWMSLPEPPGKDNNVPAKTPNEPLTLEQMREKVGQPVWVQTPGIPKYGRWVIVAGVDTEDGQRTLYCQGDYTCRNYGRDWLAYRRPPDGEEDT